MTRQRDRQLPDAALLPPLDDEPGPMPALSANEADAIAWGAVGRWAAQLPGLDPADDNVGPSRPLTQQRAEALAQRALSQHARQRLRAAPLQRAWLARAAVALLGLCCATGVALAAYRLWPGTGTREDARRDALARTTAPATASPDAAVAAPDHAPLAAADNSVPYDAQRGALPSQLSATGATPRPRAASQPDPDPRPDPEGLLARANQLRAQRRWGLAESTYRQVLRAGATDKQRYVALVAAASIALQHLAKPAQAAELYRRALNLFPNGELSEEALIGSAQSYRALHNPRAERAALLRLSAQYPESLRAPTTQRRLAELEASSTDPCCAGSQTR